MKYLDPIIATLKGFATSFLGEIPNLIIAIILLIVIHFVARLVEYLVRSSLRRVWVRPSLIQIFQKLSHIFVWLFGLLIVASIIFPSITPGHIIGALGLTSVAIGFAFKDIFENFFAGILILWREPFHLGDYIVSSKQEGYVEHVSVRNTHIRQTDGTRVILPNSILFKDPIQVYTSSPLRRVNVTVSIDFDSDTEKAREILTKAIKDSESVSQEKYIQVYIKSFSSNGVDFDLYWWTQSKPGDLRHSRDEVLSKIKAALDAAKMIPTYSTPLSFCQTLKVEGLGIEGEREGKN